MQPFNPYNYICTKIKYAFRLGRFVHLLDADLELFIQKTLWPNPSRLLGCPVVSRISVHENTPAHDITCRALLFEMCSQKAWAIKCPLACHFFSSENACLHVKYLSFADLFLAAIIRFVWCGIPLLDSTENRLACFCRFPFIFPKIK